MTNLTTRDIGVSIVKLSDENDKLRAENAALRDQITTLHTLHFIELTQTLNTILSQYKADK